MDGAGCRRQKHKLKAEEREILVLQHSREHTFVRKIIIRQSVPSKKNNDRRKISRCLGVFFQISLQKFSAIISFLTPNRSITCVDDHQSISIVLLSTELDCHHQDIPK